MTQACHGLFAPPHRLDSARNRSVCSRMGSEKAVPGVDGGGRMLEKGRDERKRDRQIETEKRKRRAERRKH